MGNLMFWLIVIEYAILASTFTIAKVTLSYADPFFLLFFRLILAGIILLLASFLLGHDSRRAIVRDKSLFLQAGLFHAFFAFAPEFWALQYISSAKTSIMYGITPFVAALLSYRIYNEKLTAQKISALIIGFSGLFPILLFTGEENLFTQVFSISIPELVLLGAIFSASYAWFIVKKLMARGHSLLVINGISMGIGGLLCGLTLLVSHGGIPPVGALVSNWPSFLAWLGLLILVAHVLSYNLYGYILKFYSITFMTLCGFLSPLFSSLYGWYFLSEPISWHHGLSLGLITAALTLYYQAERIEK